MGDSPGILFTAFEPSGDAHAAPVIRELRRRRADLKVWATGGPHMEAAGAELIESTTDRAAMLHGAVSQARVQLRRLKSLRAWVDAHPLAAHVPVDSPAANWSICSLVRRRRPSARVVHLVAPQLWAWAPWRVRKLRRLTDHVLCLLPFEPSWFEARGVPATFVGHPLYDAAPDNDVAAVTVPQAEGALPTHPQGRPESRTSNNARNRHRDLAAGASNRELRLALLPGSRDGEVRANWPTMRAVFEVLRDRHPEIRGVVAAAHDRAAALVRGDAATARLLSGSADPSLVVRAGAADAVLDESDVALVVSGTATLLTASHVCPMVAVFNTSWWVWQLLGRWLVRTRTFTLPNLIAEHGGRGRVVPEFVPHFGAVGPVASALEALVADPAARRGQIEAFRWIASTYEGRRFGRDAAGRLLELIDGRDRS